MLKDLRPLDALGRLQQGGFDSGRNLDRDKAIGGEQVVLPAFVDRVGSTGRLIAAAPGRPAADFGAHGWRRRAADCGQAVRSSIGCQRQGSSALRIVTLRGRSAHIVERRPRVRWIRSRAGSRPGLHSTHRTDGLPSSSPRISSSEQQTACSARPIAVSRGR